MWTWESVVCIKSFVIMHFASNCSRFGVLPDNIELGEAKYDMPNSAARLCPLMPQKSTWHSRMGKFDKTS